jgi:NAD(P)-dependent dehydrogenase (short-subunit alcohol dehydrogenase family)
LFESKVAVITGATGALGSVVTREMLGKGASVVVLYRSEDKFQTLWKSVGGDGDRLVGVIGDVTKENDCLSLVEEAIRRHGRVDILLNIVGGYAGGSTVTETSKEEWDRMMGLNLRSVFYCSKAVLPHMMEQDYGKIVSVSAKSAEPSGRKAKSGAYVISKAGVRVLTEVIAEEVLGYEINVNCVVPSVIDTPANRTMFPKAKFGRWVPPEEIAETILFLASDASRPIRGAAVPVFGRS